jgi:hypothetical protein
VSGSIKEERMATPTTKFRTFPNDSNSVTATNTPAKRVGTITGEDEVSTGAGEEADFGTVDISGGANTSALIYMLWDVDNNGGNTLISDMRLWLASNGFDQAGSNIQWVELCGDEISTPTNCEKIVNSGTTASYTEATLDESLPGAQNQYAADDTATIDVTTLGTTDDACMWSWYANIAASETTGTYKGLDSMFELRFNFRYSFS